MVIRIYSGIGLALALMSCQTVAAEEARQEYIGYRDRHSQRVEVYEIRENRVTFGGPEILGPGRFQSEFGGAIQTCADAQFHCFLTMLRVAVPREGTISAWTAGGHECRILDAPMLAPDRIVRILCRTNAEQSVEFSFSRAKGIVSYHRQCPGCLGEDYELVTETGLFASPTEH